MSFNRDAQQKEPIPATANTQAAVINNVTDTDVMMTDVSPATNNTQVTDKSMKANETIDLTADSPAITWKITDNDGKADNRKIYQTLQKYLGDKVFLFDPNTFATHSPLDQNSKASEAGTYNLIRHLWGYSTELGYVDGMLGKDGIITKPIVALFDTRSHINPDTNSGRRNSKRQAGFHWVAAVILPKGYVSPTGATSPSDKETIFLIDSMDPSRPLPPAMKTAFSERYMEQTVQTDVGSREEGVLISKSTTIEFVPLNDFEIQQKNGIDCGWWALTNILTVIHEGSNAPKKLAETAKINAKLPYDDVSMELILNHPLNNFRLLNLLDENFTNIARAMDKFIDNLNSWVKQVPPEAARNQIDYLSNIIEHWLNQNEDMDKDNELYALYLIYGLQERLSALGLDKSNGKKMEAALNAFIELQAKQFDAMTDEEDESEDEDLDNNTSESTSSSDESSSSDSDVDMTDKKDVKLGKTINKGVGSQTAKFEMPCPQLKFEKNTKMPSVEQWLKNASSISESSADTYRKFLNSWVRFLRTSQANLRVEYSDEDLLNAVSISESDPFTAFVCDASFRRKEFVLLKSALRKYYEYCIEKGAIEKNPIPLTLNNKQHYLHTIKLALGKSKAKKSTFYSSSDSDDSSDDESEASEEVDVIRSPALSKSKNILVKMRSIESWMDACESDSQKEKNRKIIQRFMRFVGARDVKDLAYVDYSHFCAFIGDISLNRELPKQLSPYKKALRDYFDYCLKRESSQEKNPFISKNNDNVEIFQYLENELGQVAYKKSCLAPKTKSYTPKQNIQPDSKKQDLEKLKKTVGFFIDFNFSELRLEPVNVALRAMPTPETWAKQVGNSHFQGSANQEFMRFLKIWTLDNKLEYLRQIEKNNPALMQYFADLSLRYPFEYFNRHLIAMRQYFNYCISQKAMTKNPIPYFKADAASYSDIFKIAVKTVGRDLAMQYSCVSPQNIKAVEAAKKPRVIKQDAKKSVVLKSNPNKTTGSSDKKVGAPKGQIKFLIPCPEFLEKSQGTQFPLLEVWLKTIAESIRRSYKNEMEEFLRFLSVDEKNLKRLGRLTEEHFIHYLANIAVRRKGYKVVSVVLRNYFDFCVENGGLVKSPMPTKMSTIAIAACIQNYCDEETYKKSCVYQEVKDSAQNKRKKPARDLETDSDSESEEEENQRMKKAKKLGTAADSNKVGQASSAMSKTPANENTAKAFVSLLKSGHTTLHTNKRPAQENTLTDKVSPNKIARVP